MELAHNPPPTAPLTTFTQFQSLPIELRLVIWRYALPGPRIVHLKQKQVKALDGEWWTTVRSDIAMWPCEEDDRDYQCECAYDGDEVFDDGADGGNKLGCEYDGDDIFDDCADIERLDRETVEEEVTAGSRASSIDPYLPPGHEFGDGINKPKGLWEFSTESSILDLLLTCQESRGVALKRYQRMFGSLGAVPQTYFDPLGDHLFIDNETFIGEYEDLPSLITEYMLPGDVAQVRKLVIEGLGAYEDPMYRTTDGVWELWLFETTVLFPSIRKVTETCQVNLYGPRHETGKKYIDLKSLHGRQDGIDIYGRPHTIESHAPYGTFYLNGLRIDRSFIDWDDLLDRHFDCWCDEEELHRLWKERENSKPRSQPSEPDFSWADLIPAADEQLLLHDAELFEKENNKGQWVSYKGTPFTDPPDEL